MLVPVGLVQLGASAGHEIMEHLWELVHLNDNIFLISESPSNMKIYTRGNGSE